MIIDSPTIVDMAVGVDRRVIESGDVQVFLKPEVRLTIPILKTTRSVRDSSIVQNESAFLHVSQVRFNQAALTTPIMLLAKGLWTIQMTLTSKFDWAAAAGVLGGIKAEMVYSGDTNTLLFHIATIGLFVNQVTYTYLLNEQATLQLTTDITGAAQHSDARVTVNAIRNL